MLTCGAQLCGEGRGQDAPARVAQRGDIQAGQGQVLRRVIHTSHVQQVVIHTLHLQQVVIHT